jgi:hypothetical protein
MPRFFRDKSNFYMQIHDFLWVHFRVYVKDRYGLVLSKIPWVQRIFIISLQLHEATFVRLRIIEKYSENFLWGHRFYLEFFEFDPFQPW